MLLRAVKVAVSWGVTPCIPMDRCWKYTLILSVTSVGTQISPSPPSQEPPMLLHSERGEFSRHCQVIARFFKTLQLS